MSEVEAIPESSKSTGGSAEGIQESAGKLTQLSEQLEEPAAWFRVA